MKNISLVLNVVLFIAVAFLYFKVYSKKEEQPVVVSNASAEKAAIVYVNSDTLLDNYPLLKTLEKQFENKRDSIDRILSSKDRAIKQEFADFEQRAQMMTEAQQQQEYEVFMRKQQQLVEYRDQLLKKLSDDQEHLQDSIHNNMVAYLREFNKSRGYEFILGYQRGSGILLANDSLNITNEVLKGLRGN